MQIKSNPFLAATLLLALAVSSPAANQTWDQPNADDNWNATATNWDAAATWINTNTATFAGAAGEAIALGTGITANGLTFDTAGYSISGNTLTLGATPTTITANADATISSILAGSGGLTKAGTAGLAVTGNNTLTGAMIINAGTLTSSGNWNNAGAITINNGGTLTVTAGGLYRTAAGVDSYNSYQIIINTGGTLNLKSFGYNADGALGGNQDRGTYRRLAGGTINITGGTHTANQDFYVANGSSGTFNMVTAGQTLTLGGNGNSNIAIGGPLTFGGAGNIIVTEQIDNNTGAGSIIKADAGTLTLSAANTYSGATTVNLGTLNITNTLRSSSGITVKAGATLNIGTTNVFTTSHAVAMDNARTLTVDGGTMVFTGTFDARFGNVTLKNGATWTSNRPLAAYDALLADTSTGAATVTVANTGGNTAAATMNGSGGIHLQGVQKFDVADVTGTSAADLVVNMVLGTQGSAGGNAGGINKLGAGTLLLAAANTCTGATTVNQGTLQLSGSFASAVTVADGATFAPVGSGVVNANITINSGGILDTTSATGDWTPANTRTLSVGRTTAPATDVIGNLTVYTGATLRLGSGVGTTATLTGNGNLRLDGGKTVFDLTLLPAGANDTVSLTGTLDIVTPSELNFNLVDLALGNGVYPLIAAAGGITGNLADLTPVGLPSAAGGRQTFTLSTTTVANTLTLDVTGAAGFLTWNNAAASGIWNTTAVNWKNGAVNDKFLNGDNVSLADTANAIETLTLPGTVEPVVLNAINTAATTFVLTGAGKISGNARLNLTGGGTLQLANTGGNNFTGPVTVSNSSTLRIGDVAALPTDGQVLLNGGTLDVGATVGAVAGTVTLAGAATLTATGGQLAATAIIAQGGLIAADLTGTGSLAVSNNATVQLKAAAAHTGGTTIATGSTLELLASAAIANGVVNNGLLRGAETAGVVSLAGAISGSGAVQQNGGGTLRLNGVQTYTGATTVNGGTLDLATGDARLYSDMYRTPVLTINAGGTLRAERINYAIDNNLGQLTHNSPNNVINGGTLELAGSGAASGRGWTIGVNGGTIRTLGGSAHSWSPNDNAWTQIDLNNNANALVFDVAGDFVLRSTIMDYTGTPGGAGGVSTSNGGVVKTGAGTLTFGSLTLTAAAGSHRYTGTTSVQQGTLVLDVNLGTSPVAVTNGATLTIGGGIATVGTGALTLGSTATLTLQADSATGTADRLNVTGDAALNGAILNLSDLGAATLAVGTKLTLISYTGSLTGEFGGRPEGGNITLGSNTFKLRYADAKAVTLEVVAAGYAGWASANGATGQTPDQDHDNDGVSNGIEYFMGETGSTFTKNPGVVNGKVTWKHDPTAVATFLVQLSDNLTSWTDVAPPHASIDESVAGQVTFTLPTGATQKFCRLVVTP